MTELDMHFDHQALNRVPEILEASAWGDMETAIACLGEGFRLPLEATEADLARWQAGAYVRGYGDEYAVPRRDVVMMEPTWKLAYLARLFYTIALVRRSVHPG